MGRSRVSLSALFLGLAAVPAFSTASLAHFYPRTYVSTNGSDANYCSINDPCRTFQRAFDRTYMNGEINCLDPGGYGAVVITRSVTIDCKEIPASINASDSASAVGVTINIPAGNAADPLRVVRLRGFTVSGAGQPAGTTSPTTLGTRIGLKGISIVAASAVYIEHLVISDFTTQAIQDSRSTVSKLFVLDTVTRNNGGSAINPVAAAGSATVLDNVRSEGNNFGLAVGTGNSVMVNRSVFSGNTVAGVEVDAGGIVNVNNSVVSHNGTGVQTIGIARISNSDIAFNATAATGPTITFGNNRLSGNTAVGTALTPAGGASTDIGQQ